MGSENIKLCLAHTSQAGGLSPGSVQNDRHGLFKKNLAFKMSSFCVWSIGSPDVTDVTAFYKI